MCALLALALLSRAAAAQAPPVPVTPVTLDDVIARALAENPTLAAARLRRAIGLANLQVARERPNPDFIFETARDTPHETFSTAWTIETAGKRGKRVALASATAARTDAEIG